MDAFKDDTTSIQIGNELTIENGTDAVQIYGQLAIKKDQASLAILTALENEIKNMRLVLESIGELPEIAESAPPTALDTVDNPFL